MNRNPQLIPLAEDYLRSHLAPHTSWLKQHLGPPEDRITFQIDGKIPELFLDLFGFPDSNPSSKAFELFSSVELPPNTHPHIEVRPHIEESDISWLCKWRRTPVALTIKNTSITFIYLKSASIVPAQFSAQENGYIICKKKNFSAVLEILKNVYEKNVKTLTTFNGTWNTVTKRLPNPEYLWERLVLSDELRFSVKADFEQFMTSKEWFRRNHIPYRRGYLFYGDPGNGKTQVIRMMACHPDITAFTIDFGGKDVDNTTLSKMFAEAEDQTPALLIFEDLDRMLGKQAPEEERRKITIQHFLNCLDGIDTPEGIVVVATANRPTDLDKAILKRPGRFDKVVEFKAPRASERAKYFGLYPDVFLRGNELDQAAKATDGFSFAQLRECIVTSAQRTLFEGTGKTKITLDDILFSVEQIQSHYSGLSARTKSETGFRTVG